MQPTPDPDWSIRVRDSFARQPFMALLSASIARLEPGVCELVAPFRKELGQQHGFFHAGVVGTLADDACGYAAYSLMAATSSILTVEYKLNLLAPAQGPRLRALATVVRSGRTLTVCRADVFVGEPGNERICAAAQATLIQLADTSDQPR
ncbi:MAG: PaaI family thioesterase [Planctomycetes bacterium]|nr:PaaI family thioesterase [Planctomycetota bacterium]